MAQQPRQFRLRLRSRALPVFLGQRGDHLVQRGGGGLIDGLVAQRLTQKYDKLMFVPGNNAPAFGYIAEDGAAPGAMSIGGYQNRESYRMNLGVVPELEDNMHWGGLSHGPNGIGALKPDILAPSGQMGTDIGYVWRIPEQQKQGLYKLPAGYAVDGGTSTATPMAAGATSLVLSAAKQAEARRATLLQVEKGEMLAPGIARGA